LDFIHSLETPDLPPSELRILDGDPFI
jgi:hypothetical protein